MRKNYVVPTILVCKINVPTMLAASSVGAGGEGNGLPSQSRYFDMQDYEDDDADF